MKKFIYLLLSLSLFALTAFADGNWNIFSESDKPFEADVISSDIERTLMTFNVNSYSSDRIIIDGKEYTAFDKIRLESMIEEKGAPRLPRINRSIVIPDNGRMSYKIISSEYIDIENIDIAPSKGHFSREIDPETVPYTFGDVYKKNAFYPENLVELREPYILRDYRGQVVEVNAFQYNPVTRILRVHKNITVEVYKSAPGGENVFTRNEPLTKINPQFLDIYQRHFINFNQLDYPTLFENGEMLIICYSSWVADLQPLADWKTQKGIKTTLVPSSAAGTTTDQIKNYIRNFYDTHDLTFVLLVGDGNQITTYSSGSDPIYATLVGNDNYPEIFIGRFSAENRDQVLTQVERTIDYEKFPQVGAQWYEKGLGVASNQGAGQGHFGEADYVHISLIGGKLLRYTYTLVDSAYDPWGTAAMVSTKLNNGRSTVNYCGHGSATSWGSTGFNNGNVNALTNSNMLPFIVSVACVNGSFVGTTCFAEAWLRATHDVTGEPTGAIATYMSKHNQSWAPPMDMQDEGADLMCADSMFTFGGLCFNGSMKMIDLNGATGEDEYKYWTIFGDPSLYVRNDPAYNLTVVHNPVHLIGTTSFTVTVTAPSGPLAGAQICAMNGEIYSTGITNSAGQATLNINPLLPGQFTLTVTGWNAAPYIASVDIIPPNGPYVVYDNVQVQDDQLGNNNGQWDYSETTHLGLTTENVGVSQAANAIATLTTSDPLVTIIDGSANIGNVPAGQTVYTDRAFQVQLASTVQDGHIIMFNLNVSDGTNNWPSNFTMSAHAPVIEYSGLEVNDFEFGNGNGNLDPGETALLLVSLTDNGSAYANDVNGILSTSDPYVTINSANYFYGGFLVGSTLQGQYNVTVNASCPQEHLVDFNIALTGALGYSGSTAFSTTVGDIMFAPAGPDNYGYLCYDQFDSPFLPEYSWVEISADSGGQGTEIAFTADDQTFSFALPFTFRYYGVDYNDYSVCSNGFLTMGITTDTDYSNSAIPNSDGPSAMIAPYWEDMSPQRTNSGGVWHWYDTANHRFIVEYCHIEQYSPVGNFETFQVIFLDPAFYQTSTGDGQIKIQYWQMSGASATEGTIGIENPAENDGLQILYDGDYEEHSAHIGYGTVYLFTTPLTGPSLTVSVEPASLPITIPAAGGTFQFTASIANTGSTPVSVDFWTDALLPNGSLYGPIFTRLDLNLNAGASLSRLLTQNIPGTAPAGNYTYSGKLGQLPSTVYVSDSFPFTKAGVDGSAFGNWSVTGWDEEVISAVIPTAYYLKQNYPNPFNPETSIAFGLPESGEISLKVYNLLGETVAVLAEGFLPAGSYEFKWSAVNVSSGLYFYKLESPSFTSVKKMMLVR